jgi:hypothetical protein
MAQRGLTKLQTGKKREKINVLPEAKALDSYFSLIKERKMPWKLKGSGGIKYPTRLT